jgi:hypothetical protein
MEECGMRKLALFVGSLTLGGVLLSAGAFTNSGNASLTCSRQSSPFDVITVTATGSSIDLSCPDGYFGTAVIGFANDLSTGASTGPLHIDPPSYAFQSTFVDSLVPVGGTGQGIVEFTLTYNWQNVGDNGTGITAGDFIFNGLPVWSRSDPTCLFGEPCWDEPFSIT